jgi:hypothetical protein
MDNASVISNMHMNKDFLKSYSSACLTKSLKLGHKRKGADKNVRPFENDF